MQPGDTNKVVALFKNRPLEFEPGMQYKYSNSGYVLLAAIIEKAAGKSYEKWLKESIFTPLGMNDTGLMYTVPILTHRASRYQMTETGIENAPYSDLTSGVGDGSLHSTVEDLYKWDRSLYTDAIVSQILIAQMMTPCKENYCFGWVSKKILNHHCIYHCGGWAGAATGIYRFIDDDICIILLSNITPSPIGHMAKDIAAILFDKRYDIPQDLTRGIVLTDKELDDYCGRFQLPDYHKIPEKPGIVVLTKQDGMLLSSSDDLPTVELIILQKRCFLF